MPTKNVTVTQAWTNLSSASDGTLLISWQDPSVLEIATTSAMVEPTVIGHRFNTEEEISRSDLGDGYVWARTVASSYQKRVTVVVTG